jgi:outer membrane protein TolC
MHTIKILQCLGFNYLILFLVILFQSSFGQAVHVLNLEACQKIAGERSYNMKTLQEDFKIAEFELKAAVNQFKTQINLQLTAPDYSETISSLQDSSGTHYFPTKQAAYSGNLHISQPLPTDGNIYISSGVYYNQDYHEKEKSFRLNTRIGLEQPIESIYSYNRIKSSLKLAELNYELSKRRLTRAKLNLAYDVSQAFYNLHSAVERKKISLQSLDQQRETYELAKNKYKAGVIAEVEALQMEVDLGEAQNSYDVSIANRNAEANYLKQMLGISLIDSLVVEADLSYQEVEVDLQKALEYGLKNRLEIREREITEEQTELNIASVKVNHQITGTISAYYDFIGVDQQNSSIALHTNFENAWQELKRRPGNRGVALNINIPLWDWGVNDARVQAARAGLRKAKMSLNNEKITVERDIRDTVNRLKSSLKRLKLLEKNVLVAERSFYISKQRFANGDINSQSLALDRIRLNQAYNSRLSALISYKLLLSDIKRKTFYDFINNQEVENIE